MSDEQGAIEALEDVITRRALLGGVSALLAVPVSGIVLIGDADAKKKKKKKKKRKKRRKKKKKKKSANSAASAQPEIDAEESAFLTLINNYRVENGLGPLSINAQLSLAAALHSLDMGQRNFFDHVNKQGQDPADRAEAAGYRNWSDIGENIAAGTNEDTAAEAFAMWQSSPPHNANMLSSDFLEIGIGRVHVPGSKYAWYWTTVFGATA